MWCTISHCLTDKGSSNVSGFILRSTGRPGLLVLLGSSLALVALSALSSWAAGPPWPVDNSRCGKVDANSITVPEDFRITYKEGPQGLPFGRETTLRVLATGDFVIEQIALRGRVPKKEDVKVLVKNRISLGRVKRIYARVVACDFFSLEQYYDNRNIRDGKQEFIHVTADGKSHYVGVHYFLVHRFSAIRSTIFREVPIAGDYL